MYVCQCLNAARDGFGADESSKKLKQLYKLEDLLTAGAIPNATMVRYRLSMTSHSRYSVV